MYWISYAGYRLFFDFGVILSLLTPEYTVHTEFKWI